jgi:class 3 adenylate cyclase
MNSNRPIRPRPSDPAHEPPPFLTAQLSLPPVTPLATLHHDIRTALYQVIGYIEILLEDAEAHDRSAILPQLRQVHAEAKSTQEALKVFFVAPQGASELRLRELRERLLEAGGIMVGRGEELESLVAMEASAGLLSDLRRFQTAARNLLASADFITGAGTLGALELAVEPAGTCSASSESALPSPFPIPSKSEEPRGNPLMLIVDDNEANRDILSRRLKREGYQVLVAENGQRALDMARERDLDLILLDVLMPQMDGIAVLRELKSDARLRHVPVVMISSVSEIQSVVRCIEMGAEDYLSKPFNPVLLRARVGALLERKRLRDEEQRKNEELAKALLEIQRQQRLAEELLCNILPAQVAHELQAKGSVEPMYFEDVTIVFADFVGFTVSTEKLPADSLVRVLHEYFTAFDRIVESYGLEKLKTIGDCYMFAGGLPVRCSSHPVEAVLATLEMVHAVQRMASPRGLVDWQLRVGMHTGPVIAGVVGIRKFAFDIWGDTVNFSARMESSSTPNRVNLSATTYARVKDFFLCEPRGKIKTKDGRKLDMYFASGVAPTLLGDGSQSMLSAFKHRYYSYFQKELKSFPEFLLKG